MVRKIIITRETPLNKELCARLNSHGFEAYHIPLIKFVTNPLPELIESKIPNADWVFFTSANAVKSFYPHWHHSDLKIATIGPQTSLSVRELGGVVAFESSRYYAVDFLEEWVKITSRAETILLPQSNLSRAYLEQKLKDYGHKVYAWSMYNNIQNKNGQSRIHDFLVNEDVIWTFASNSAWKSFISVVNKIPNNHKIAVIGKSTYYGVVEDKCKVDIIASVPTMTSMINQIIEREAN